MRCKKKYGFRNCANVRKFWKTTSPLCAFWIRNKFFDWQATELLEWVNKKKVWFSKWTMTFAFISNKKPQRRHHHSTRRKRIKNAKNENHIKDCNKKFGPSFVSPFIWKLWKVLFPWIYAELILPTNFHVVHKNVGVYKPYWYECTTPTQSTIVWGQYT